jgi:Mg-chelatase subunit ChlD
MKSGLDALRDSTLPEIYYADVPTPTDAFVVSLAEVSAALDSHYTRARNIGTTLYASWKRENSAAVQTLAQEFDRRQAADSHKRVSIAETGSIDPNRLHAYRIAEDIFLQNASVRDGKNHGIIVMLDMSGSMRDVFHDTMIQLITLGHFCKRVNVPFRFYGFTDQAGGFSLKANWIDNSFGLEKNDTRLITLLQDGMRTVDFVRQCGNLLMASYRGIKDTHPSAVAWNGVMNRIGGTDGYQSVAPPPFFHLNNTPTNSALLGMATLLPAFKAAKRLQVVNLVVLTDGEATDSLTSYNYAKQNGATGGREQSTVVWRDATTRKTYATGVRRHGYINQLSSQEQTKVILQLVKDRTGVNTVCLRLEGSSSGGSAVRTLVRRSLLVPGAELTSVKMDQDHAVANAAGEKFQDAGWYALGTTEGFDQYIIVKSEYAHDHTSIDSVDMNSKSALRDLRKNFTKMMANRNNNRPLLAQIADILARAAH